MKNLIAIFIFFTLSAYSCNLFPDPPAPLGYEKEPTIQIVFHNQSFITYTASANKDKKIVKTNNKPGIDMNASSTKFWITRASKVDSFTVNYKLKTFYKEGKSWIDFDTLYLSQSTFANAMLYYYPFSCRTVWFGVEDDCGAYILIKE